MRNFGEVLMYLGMLLVFGSFIAVGGFVAWYFVTEVMSSAPIVLRLSVIVGCIGLVACVAGSLLEGDVDEK